MELALFFTRGVSLELWVKNGLLDHEKAIYEYLLDSGKLSSVFFLTYGRNDCRIALQLKKENELDERIHVLSMPFFFNNKLGISLYSLICPLIHRKELRKADLFKTNQIEGCWTAIIAKWLLHRPVIVRSGYIPSLVQKDYKSKRNLKYIYCRCVETLAYRFADFVFIPNELSRQYVRGVYPRIRNKNEVIPNYVDTAKFKPMDKQKDRNRFIFVGRITPIKNLWNLVDAVHKIGCRLDIFGSGPMRKEMESYVEQCGAQVKFEGVVPNDRLPEILNRYSFFILPSFYEAMPKTLLEAMGCGLVCLGTDVGGIAEIIHDGDNGFLIHGTEIDAIISAMLRVRDVDVEAVSRNAVKTIQNFYDIKSVAEKECPIMQRLLETK